MDRTVIFDEAWIQNSLHRLLTQKRQLLQLEQYLVLAERDAEMDCFGEFQALIASVRALEQSLEKTASALNEYQQRMYAAASKIQALITRAEAQDSSLF